MVCRFYYIQIVLYNKNCIAGIGKAVLIGFVLLLVVVGAMGFLARRKSL